MRQAPEKSPQNLIQREWSICCRSHLTVATKATMIERNPLMGCAAKSAPKDRITMMMIEALTTQRGTKTAISRRRGKQKRAPGESIIRPIRLNARTPKPPPRRFVRVERKERQFMRRAVILR